MRQDEMTNASIDEEAIALPDPRDRPVTLAHRAEFAVILVIGAFLRMIGIDAASALAGGIARMIGPMLKPISDRARTNLAIAFPTMSQEEQAAIIRGVWENLGRTTGEFAHLAKLDPYAQNPRVEIVGQEKFEAVIASGKPAIFVSGHFANWEAMPTTMHAVGLDYAFVYRAANNPLIDGFIIRERARVMSRRQIPKGKRGGRDVIDALKSGRSLAMLIDQKLTTGGISSPLFGRPAMTAPAAARLSLKYGAPLIPVKLERLEGARFRLTVCDPIDFTRSGDANADTQALTDRLNLEIERMIRARPEQWLWLHRRWPKEAYARINPAGLQSSDIHPAKRR
jgi:KDO2-lipid IV(A) lauroyltransferase